MTIGETLSLPRDLLDLSLNSTIFGFVSRKGVSPGGGLDPTGYPTSSRLSRMLR